MKRLTARLAITAVVLSTAVAPATSQVPCTVENWAGAGGIKWSAPRITPVKVGDNIPWAQAGKNRWDFDKGKDQWGQWWGSVSTDGRVSLGLEFANGSKLDGDHFAAILVLRDAHGQALLDVQGNPATAQFRAGVDAKGVCHARGKNYKCYKKTSSKVVQLGPKNLARLHHIEQRHGRYDSINDQTFWSNVRSVASCVGFAT